MKILAYSILLVLFPFGLLAQEYRNWEEHDIIRFYKKVEQETFTIDENGEEINVVYIPTKVKDGSYRVELVKISSNLYRIGGTDIYRLFRYTPYLYSHDEGILEVSYSSGVFYEKSD